jgi:hypothetical protein
MLLLMHLSSILGIRGAFGLASMFHEDNRYPV